ncbi:MAG: inositol monophosphatase [Gammaproteobacteria bacterium]|nr:inositol monophosphatase [Gammaproteobacteria bacterium]
MHPLMTIATKAARSAGKIILRATDRLDTIQVGEKGHNNFVTEVDQQVEQEIINIILDSYPDHAILGEESGVSGTGDYTWIIDPIDGTNNFIHGHPHFCVSIAVKYKDRIEHGLIYDPLRQELFTATFGAGAFLNDRRIRVASRKQLEGSVIASSFGNKASKEIGIFLKILASILPYAAGTRRSGSAALDLAYVACGRLDGAWGINLSPWDIAAGTLIIQEAGGIVTDLGSNDNYLTTGSLIAGNQNIHKIILQLVQEKVLT